MPTMPPASRRSARSSRGLSHRYKRTIGAVSIPGDRRDEDIIEMGRIAAGIFDELIFREDPGHPRPPARRGDDHLLSKARWQRGRSPDHHPPHRRRDARRRRRRWPWAGPGDLIVITPTDVNGAWQQVNDFRPAAERTSGRAAFLAAE